MGEAGRPDGQRRSDMTAAAVGIGGLAQWRGHARRCRPSRLCVHRAAAAPSSEWCIFHRHYVSPSVPTQNEIRAGGVGEAPNLPYPVSRSQSRTSVNDARPCKLYMQPDIHVRRQCGDVMYVCMPFDTSYGRTDRNNAERTAIDIKAHTPLIRFVVDLLLVCCT